MFMQTCKGDDGIYNLHQCETCNWLMDEFFFGLDEDVMEYHEGCVKEELPEGQTPEMLLQQLRDSIDQLEKNSA